MKKILTMIVVAVMAIGLSSNIYAGQRIAPDQIPASLTAFTAKYFGKDAGVVKAERDRHHNQYEYDVTLNNGVQIEWGASDQWLEISAPSGVPDTIEPMISLFVKEVYPSATIVKIEREKKGFEVKLNTGVELIFNRDKKFVKVSR